MVAQYLGFFQASSSAGGITSGSQWLVWRFESDSTLGDACDGALGPFPVSWWVGGWAAGWGMCVHWVGWWGAAGLVAGSPSGLCLAASPQPSTPCTKLYCSINPLPLPVLSRHAGLPGGADAGGAAGGGNGRGEAGGCHRARSHAQAAHRCGSGCCGVCGWRCRDARAWHLWCCSHYRF